MPDTTTNPVNINKHNPWLNETNEELAARYNALTTAGMSHPHGLIAEILARPNVFPGFKRGQRTVKVAWTKQDIIEPGTTILTPRGTRVYAKKLCNNQKPKVKTSFELQFENRKVEEPVPPKPDGANQPQSDAYWLKKKRDLIKYSKVKNSIFVLNAAEPEFPREIAANNGTKESVNTVRIEQTGVTLNGQSISTVYINSLATISGLIDASPEWIPLMQNTMMAVPYDNKTKLQLFFPDGKPWNPHKPVVKTSENMADIGHELVAILENAQEISFAMADVCARSRGVYRNR